MLLGFADLFFPATGIEIYGCKFFRKEGQEWIKLPDKEYIDMEQKKFAPIIRFRERSRDNQFQLYAKKAIKEYCFIHEIPVDVGDITRN